MDARKRRRLLVALGVAVGLIYTLLLGYILLGDLPNPSQGEPVAAQAPSGATAPAIVELWDACQQAHVVAQAAAADAELVSAATHWEGPDERTMLSGADSWSFVFYSPASGNVLDIVVGRGEARLVNQTRVWDVPEPLPDGAWQAGPEEPLLVFLACDGRSFLEAHPGALVDVRLAVDDAGRAAWSVVALDAADRSLLSVSVDAGSHEILSRSPGWGVDEDGEGE